MSSVDRFSLETHEGPRETWPLQSWLLENGRATPVCIPGYFLRHQFETPDGYLFIADYDCPFEESQEFALVSRDHAVLGTVSLGAMYGTYWIDRLDWLDERHLQITIHSDDIWVLTPAALGHPVSRSTARAPEDSACRLSRRNLAQSARSLKSLGADNYHWQ